MNYTRKRKGWFLRGLLCLFLLLRSFSVRASGEASWELADACREYQKALASIENVEDIEKNGYEIQEDQTFSVLFESFGEELTFLPAMERTWHRLALFLVDEQGRVRYKSSDLEANYWVPGELRQPVREVASVAFADADRDGLTDLLLITRCVNDSGEYAGVPYKVGDILFQGDQTFYRDWRISDKINRFDMNKSANCMLSFARDGESLEYLYTATTLEELLRHGFSVFEEMSYTREFEKLGKLKVVPGTASISEYDIFLIYLVNEQGEIVWSFQPMKDYDGLYSLNGVHGRDVDGDGMKDLVVLARYSCDSSGKEQAIETHCSVYYQRTGGFEVDTEFEKIYPCTEKDTMEDLVRRIRGYWGWQAEE